VAVWGLPSFAAAPEPSHWHRAVPYAQNRDAGSTFRPIGWSLGLFLLAIVGVVLLSLTVVAERVRNWVTAIMTAAVTGVLV
jgi:hypothetical protein